MVECLVRRGTGVIPSEKRPGGSVPGEVTTPPYSTSDIRRGRLVGAAHAASAAHASEIRNDVILRKNRFLIIPD